MPYRICNFLTPNGHPCGSPALLGKKLCYYHLRDSQREQRVDTALRRADVLGPRLPPMRSHRQIRTALTEVFQALWAGRIADDRAGRILFDLQQATVALREPRSRRK